MFYYPNVLQRHTGCFATIWLAATRGSRLVKREYLKVNVVKTCEEILDYVLVRVQPPLPGLPRPRFSLYLSAQLQIGVIRVYSQQCQYLVEDIQHILERLHRAQLQIRIDMVEMELPSLLLPNRLAMMETLEDAPDPFFGMMSVGPTLPSPFRIPQIRRLLEAVTPERVLEEVPPEVPVEPRKPDRVPVTVLPPEAITLREAEPIRMLPIEGERDLPEVSRRDLDLLIAEEDEAILLEERERRARLALDEYKEEPRAPEGVTVVPPLSPPAVAPEEGVAEPPLVLAPEEVKPVGWEPEALLAEVTPPPELRLPAPLIPERRRPPVPPYPRRLPARRRRRQLLFWDKETQISREKFQEQLQTRAHCWECPKVQPPERTAKSPTELFRIPAHSGWLPPELLALWTHCAQPPPEALRRRPPLEPEEEAERELAAEEERRMETLSDIEVPREAQEPSGPLMLSSGSLDLFSSPTWVLLASHCTAVASGSTSGPQGPDHSDLSRPTQALPLPPTEISLETVEEEKSRISLIPPEERWAWAEAEQPEPPALPAVPEVPEMPLELPAALPLEPELLSLEAVYRAVAQELQANREPDFGSLVPPLSPRRMAARVFYLLLVLAAQQILRLEQDQPYGRLLIRLGPRFHCG
ncbi:meiotic recombination protein REC8 homolog isoform X2 [Ailuropoda melanoleuca]|uniref:meiotic recombination protein REC8 homolog isoform X2 n=1 Tax=Ailuropoda melanoleuca TaxID=9646 RepID=UPI0009482AD3|nr:meiotic recombination protein REC8 homolog isoform X2 [Ailuropoda melanoleuca]